MKKKDTIFDRVKEELEVLQKQRRKGREYIYPKMCPYCRQPLDKEFKKIWKCRNCGRHIVPIVRIWN